MTKRSYILPTAISFTTYYNVLPGELPNHTNATNSLCSATTR
jgi:hypothetical protein